MEAAEEHRQHRQPMLSADQLREQTMRESLELSRERILRELHESEHARRRKQLEAALAHLDLKLQQLNVSNPAPPVV